MSLPGFRTKDMYIYFLFNPMAHKTTKLYGVLVVPSAKGLTECNVNIRSVDRAAKTRTNMICSGSFRLGTGSSINYWLRD